MRYSQQGIARDGMPFGKLFAAGAAALGLVVSMAASTFAAGTVTVTPSNMQGWTSNEGGGGSSAIVEDATAPGGSALQLKTDDTNTAYTEYYHDVNVPLSQVGDLSYMTNTLAGPSHASASYAIGLDTDGVAGTDVYYVYEPYWQVNFGGQAVTQNTWQTWDVKSGMFWATGSGTTKPSLSWADILAANPNATVSEVAVYQGSYNPNYTVNVDNVVVNGTTYDFQVASANEPVVATSKDQCKANGWKNVVTQDGKTFKNQGQCVAYVQSSANSKHHRSTVE